MSEQALLLVRATREEWVGRTIRQMIGFSRSAHIRSISSKLSQSTSFFSSCSKEKNERYEPFCRIISIFTDWKSVANASRSMGCGLHLAASARSSLVNALSEGLLGGATETIKCNFDPSIIWWSASEPSCNGFPLRTNFCWCGGMFNCLARRNLTSWMVSVGET